MRRAASAALITLAAITSIACGGGGNGVSNPVGPSANPSPAPSPVPQPPTAGLQPTFSSIRAQIFQVWCVVCHTSAGTPQGSLSLDAPIAYQNLVNVRSVGKPAAVRVVPGDPGNSYLIQKLEGRADIVGDRMPLGGPYLSQSDIDVIRAWISQGAPNN